MNEHKLSEKTYTNSVKSTVFADGMIVNSDDLNTAMMYPIELMQMFMQAYFGCGVVCGLQLSLVGKENENNFCLQVDSGVALDCMGYPMKLCEKQTINLTPESCDPCNPIDYKNLPVTVYVAIKRTSVPEAPRSEGGCTTEGQAQCTHTRAAEAIVVKVFTKEQLPDCLCYKQTRTVDANGNNQYTAASDDCDCLKDCGECHCCDCCSESWVLLGSVKISDTGLSELNNDLRRFIKPIECLCDSRASRPSRQPPAQGQDDTYDKVQQAQALLDEKMKQEQALEKQLTSIRAERELMVKEAMINRESVAAELAVARADLTTAKAELANVTIEKAELAKLEISPEELKKAELTRTAALKEAEATETLSKTTATKETAAKKTTRTRTTKTTPPEEKK